MVLIMYVDINHILPAFFFHIWIHCSLSDIVSLKDRGKYQGINEAVIAVSNGLGPLVGGLFSQYVTWCVIRAA